MAATLPIAHLEQASHDTGDSTILGVVTLLWPYSSSTRRAAILLAEPDFRLRKSKGQVRIQFAGAAAEAIAQSRISSGDEVRLSLRGARRVDAPAGIVSTPGRSVDIELVFKRQLVCEITRDGQVLTSLDILDDCPSPPASVDASPTSSYHAVPPQKGTPTLHRANGLSTPASSAFHRRARVVSGELVDSPYDPFVKDSSGTKKIGSDRKRQRLSWGLGDRWQVQEAAPSPSKRRDGNDWIRDEELVSPQKRRIPVRAESTPSPSRSGPHRHRQESDRQSREQSVGEGTEELRVVTPQISPTRSARTLRAGRVVSPATQRYTQELVDLVSGDTEEEDFSQVLRDEERSEDEDVAAVEEAFGAPMTFTGKQKLSVFRDPSLNSTSSSNIFQPKTRKQRGDTLRQGFEPKVSVSPAAAELTFEGGPQSAAQQEVEAQDPVQRQPQDKPIMTPQTSSAPPPDLPTTLDILSEQGIIQPLLPANSASAPLMPPPALPLLQTNNLLGQSSDPMPMPQSALPHSPQTPDLRPQLASALPLPSPFPGEELQGSSYVDFTPQRPTSGVDFGSSFGSMGEVTSPLLPDWMLQVGFGFGSQGFTRSPERHAEPVEQGQLGRVEESTQQHAHQLYQDLQSVDARVDEHPEREFSTDPDFSKDLALFINEPQEGTILDAVDIRRPSMTEDRARIASPHALETFADGDVVVEPKALPQSTADATHVSEVTDSQLRGYMTDGYVSDTDRQEPFLDTMQPHHSARIGVDAMPMDDANVLAGIADGGNEESAPDKRGEVGASERGSEEREDRWNGSPAAEPGSAYDEDDEQSRMEDDEDNLSDDTAVGSKPAIPRLIQAAAPQSSALRREPVVIDLLEDSDESDEEEEDDDDDHADDDDDDQDDRVGSSLRDQSDDRSKLQRLIAAVRSQTGSQDSSREIPSSSPRPPDQAHPTSEVQATGSLYESSINAKHGVTFAPRVTRRRAAAEAQTPADLEPQPSLPLATSPTAQRRPPRLVVQDTFEGFVHSDGSVTTAPPSRGSDGRAPGLAEIPEAGEDEKADGADGYTDLGTFDGIVKSRIEIPSSPPQISPADMEERITYPDLPFVPETEPLLVAEPFTGGQTLPVTPEMGQVAGPQLSKQPSQTAEQLSRPMTLPISPRETQSTFIPSFYSEAVVDAGQRDDTNELPDAPVDINLPSSPGRQQQDEEMTFSPPRDRKFEEIRSAASEILSPWFKKRSIRLSEVREYREQLVEEGRLSSKAERNGQSNGHTADAQQLPSEHRVEDSQATLPAEKRLSSPPAADQVPETIPFDSQLPTSDDLDQTQTQLAHQAKGLLTNYSYYTPLPSLRPLLNSSSHLAQSSQQGTDLLCIVTSSTTKPTRAPAGPRDYFTSFYVTDRYTWPGTVRVTCFRPWRAALPKAEAGDVVLLRGFDVISVKSKKETSLGVSLRSNDRSGWCVWRFGKSSVLKDASSSFGLAGFSDDDPKIPAWSQREVVTTEKVLTIEEREDMRGPPVEYGDEERVFVRELREWWGDGQSRQIQQ